MHDTSCTKLRSVTWIVLMIVAMFVMMIGLMIVAFIVAMIVTMIVYYSPTTTVAHIICYGIF